ncbi:hypothetical protein [Hymenobacter psychrophilus]|uniref:Erythromycin esterase homolog n=1 Tax=Hymenobacter psychrophilus TaxID=651662 RepID=A0A1H3CWB6_9BACT|nr:hypothetical protein [Hymenobacter psychrophilus]SDX58512.1 hypothetical protein SAMN04488069_102140 [Hymenobacter psychrophilus]
MFRLALPAAFRSVPVRGLGALAALVLTTLNSPAAQAQTAAASLDTTFTRLLHKYQYPLTQTGTQLSGAGWEKLRNDIQESALVLIGEDHGMAQIPQFTQAVAQVQKPKVYVAEIDQYQARDLSRLADQPGLPVAFNRQHPMELAFYSWQEEFELAQALRRQQTAFVGVEQVGAATAGRLLTLMAEQSKNKATKAYLSNRAIVYQWRDRADMVSGTYKRTTLINLQPSTIDSLRAMTRAESPAVRQMVEDLVFSSQIFKTGDHRTRVNLMKRNLLAGLRPYDQPGQPLPNMLFKFGAYHLGRGRSIWGDIYDVGNLASNLADAHDQKSLHIFVMGKQGAKTGGFNPDDFSKNAVAYSNADEDMLKPFMAATPAGSAWQVFDLRPLRRALLRDKLNVRSTDLEATILGYDYVVIIPETTASRNF